MLKRLELTDPRSCMNRAEDDEPTFVLLARDKSAPVAIRSWVRARILSGKNHAHDAQIYEALECARLMEWWRRAWNRPRA